MNSRLASLLSLAFLVGLAVSAPTEQTLKFDVTVSGNASNVQQEDGTFKDDPFEVACDYSISGFDDWAVVEVSFHKEVMPMIDGQQYPMLAEYKKNNTKQEKATFRTVHQVEGVKVQPEGGKQEQALSSPMKVVAGPSKNSELMFAAHTGQWKCSVTIQQKKEGGEKFFQMSDNSYMAWNPVSQ